MGCLKSVHEKHSSSKEIVLPELSVDDNVIEPVNVGLSTCVLDHCSAIIQPHQVSVFHYKGHKVDEKKGRLMDFLLLLLVTVSRS